MDSLFGQSGNCGFASFVPAVWICQKTGCSRDIETYYFLECESGAKMQLNEEFIGVQPGDCILIRPGTRHRAIGQMKVLIVVYPKFDETDEWFD